MAQEEIIKARIAETIVRCMFEDLGFEVVPYGYEHTCPTIARKDRLIKGDFKNHIRKSPDFIIVDKDNNAHFIEVKYRADGVYKKTPEPYPYQDCYIILLSKEHIGIEQHKFLDAETKMTGANFNPYQKLKATHGSFKSLMDVPLFQGLDKQTILDYKALLEKYMKG